jgi:hypothetical protein
VELKLFDVAGVIRQAKANRYVANLSYAAMPKERVIHMRPQTLDKFTALGIGLLSVDIWSVSEILAPTYNDICLPRHRYQRVWRRFRQAVSSTSGS